MTDASIQLMKKFMKRAIYFHYGWTQKDPFKRARAHPHTASYLVLREGLKKNAQEKYYCRDNDTPLRVTAFQGKAK